MKSPEKSEQETAQKEVISLLRSKNRCLERYLELSEAFWESARVGTQDGNSRANALSDLPAFEARRDASLRAIDLYDRKLGETLAKLDGAETVTNESRIASFKDAIRAELARKEIIIHRILAVDTNIIACIEEAKRSLLEEANVARRGKDAISKFKSRRVREGGDELDREV